MAILTVSQPLIEAQKRIMKESRREFSHVPNIKNAKSAAEMLAAFDAHRKALVESSNAKILLIQQTAERYDIPRLVNGVQRETRAECVKLTQLRNRLRLTF